MPSSQPTHHGYAVNVKDHAFYDAERGDLTDDQVQAIYEDVQEDFWLEAVDIAQAHGFRDVYGEGRMGGWAVPRPQPDYDIDERHEQAWLDDRFRPFERDILALMAEAQEAFLVRLAFEVERAAAEPAERAYWAARDTITIDN